MGHAKKRPDTSPYIVENEILFGEGACLMAYELGGAQEDW